jgi:hypothetical protein
MSSYTTTSGNTSDAASAMPVADAIDPMAGHPWVEPAEVTPTMSSTVDAALAHVMDVNRHQRALTRMAQNRSVALAIYLELTAATVVELLDGGTGGGFDCQRCEVLSYAKHGLLAEGDEFALMVAQTRAARTAMRFPCPPTEDELALLHHEPASIVAAAYALARGLQY